jgi:phosphoglycolate phosphatase-like HAD superfamily hydrolase
MNTIKLIAVDIDGVLLKDTFSPVIKALVEKFGGEYSSRIERNVFSRPQQEAAQYIIDLLHLNYNIKEMLDIYFKERKGYIKKNGSGILDGVPGFLELLKTLDTGTICYGGLPEEYFRDEMEEYAGYFERYVCTNDFRPGIKEITKDIYGLDYKQVLFIDDVNTVAETAKSLNTAFIGCPSSFQWGFQRQDMIKTGVRYLVKSVGEINESMLEKIDFESGCGKIWDN